MATRKHEFIEECAGMTHDQIIAGHHSDYYDATMPWIKHAFEAMGIEDHEVSVWVTKNIK